MHLIRVSKAHSRGKRAALRFFSAICLESLAYCNWYIGAIALEKRKSGALPRKCALLARTWFAALTALKHSARDLLRKSDRDFRCLSRFFSAVWLNGPEETLFFGKTTIILAV